MAWYDLFGGKYQGQSVMQGAGSGAMAGASFGMNPLTIGAGALIGGIGGLFAEKPKSAEEMGINKFDAMAEARKFMPSDAELNTQRNAFNASNNQNIDEYAKQLIASGMNPQQAYTVAQNKMSSNVNKFESSQQQAVAGQQRQLGQSLLPMQFQRDEDILNYDLSMSQRPSYGAQTGIMAGAVNAFRGGDGTNSLFNWASGFMNPQTPNP